MSDACCGTDHCHTVAPTPPLNIFREHARELWILAVAGAEGSGRYPQQPGPDAGHAAEA